MSGQEFLINHTIKHIERIENDGHFDIGNELRKMVENYDWKLTDAIELIFYETCDKDSMAVLILNENYRIEPEYEKWFVY